MSWLGVISTRINAVVEFIVVVLMFALTLFSTAGVLTRYFIGKPILWLYESTLVTFAWTVFLACSIAFKRREHIQLDFVLARLKGKAALLFQGVLLSVILLFLLIGIWQGYEIILNTIPQKYHTIDLSTAWFYASFPVSALLSLVHIAAQLSALFWPDGQREV